MTELQKLTEAYEAAQVAVDAANKARLITAVSLRDAEAADEAADTAWRGVSEVRYDASKALLNYRKANQTGETE